MKSLRQLKGMSVLSLQEGEQLGKVRELILDPTTAQVAALVLDRRTAKGELQVVATANVRSVGPEAITVEDRGSLVPLDRIPRFQALARAGSPIHGKTVISEQGERIGRIADLWVDPETFRIVSLELYKFLGRGQTIPIEQVRTIGQDAIVMREQAPPLRPPPPPAPITPIPQAQPEEFAPPPPPPPPTPLPDTLEEMDLGEPVVPPVSILDEADQPPDEDTDEDMPADDYPVPPAEPASEAGPADEAEPAETDEPGGPTWLRRFRRRS